jgi:hypothetical protein
MVTITLAPAEIASMIFLLEIGTETEADRRGGWAKTLSETDSKIREEEMSLRVKVMRRALVSQASSLIYL